MNEKVFIPAHPTVTPTPKPAPKAEPTKPADAQSQTPASVTKKVSSRMTVGAPSKHAPPHINPTKIVTSTPGAGAATPPKREYAWQRRRALGKKF